MDRIFKIYPGLTSIMNMLFFANALINYNNNINHVNPLTELINIRFFKDKNHQDSSLARFKKSDNQVSKRETKSKSTPLLNLKNENWHDIEPVSNNIVYAYSYGTGKFIKSTNNGKDWKLIKQFDSIYYEQMQFINLRSGWICGANGSILFTKNGGISWIDNSIKTQEGKYLFYGLLFIGENRGYVSGALLQNRQLTGKLFSTNTAGRNWKEIRLPFSNSILNIKKNKDIIYFSGDNIIGNIKDDTVKILYSDTSNLTGQIRDLVFLNDSTIAAVSFNGKYIFSNDHGKKWVVSSITKNRLRSIVYVNGVLAAAGDANREPGVLFYSKDLGKNWMPQLDNFFDIHRLVVFKNRIWMAGKNGTLKFLSDL